jgi:O-antigen ligase
VPDPVEKFRKLTGKRRRRRRDKPSRPPVPPREWALAALLLLNILWLSFALGGVRLWGELTALALALASLFLLPRWSNGEIPGAPRPVLQLLKLPLFWLGLGLYGFFAIQAWNLAWDWTTAPDGRPKLVSQTPPVSWLPSGLESPLDESNPLRSMIFYAIPWIACCVAWAGLSTRRATAFLLHGLALCGVAFAAVALRQHFTNAELILGLFPTVPSRVGTEIPFWGTLINGNHAAYYLILANGLCLGLFLSGWHRDLRNFRRGGGAWLLYLGCSVTVTFAVLLAQARGAIGVLVAQWLLFLGICSVFLIRRFGLRGVPFPAVVLVILLGIVAVFIVNPQVYERQKAEWIRTFELVENPELEARYYMMEISRDMIRDKPWFGHGAGGFRYLHLPYMAAYPEFKAKTERPRWQRNPVTGKNERRTVTLWFQNAHVDLLEYLVEWGIIGCLFPLLAFLWLVYRSLRSLRGWDAGATTILMTAFVVWLGAAVEFHFRIPLVLLAWCLAITVTVKLADLQSRNEPVPN